MRGKLVRALGVTALVFAGCFAVVLGVLVFGEPGVPSLGGNRVALVEVEGLIVDADRVVRELGDYGEDPSIRAIVVRIQSPGGVVGPTQEIYDAILKIRTQGKPVVASMGSVAASGGYYLAAAATRIVANPGTLTGSIGVIMQLAEIEGLLKKVGVRYEVIKAGPVQGQRVVRPAHDAGGARRPPGRPRRHARPVRDGRSPRVAGSGRSGCGRWRTGGCTRGGWRRTSVSSTPWGDWTRRSGSPASWAGFRASRASSGPAAPGGFSTWPTWWAARAALTWLRSAGWPGPGLPALPVLGSSKLPLYLLD